MPEIDLAVLGQDPRYGGGAGAQLERFMAGAVDAGRRPHDPLDRCGDRRRASDRLHPIQEAFVEAGAVQCGFCSAGMILLIKALWDTEMDRSQEEVRRALSGNLCRCTGYRSILEAAMEVLATPRDGAAL